jgi:apolipoprotein N-acyltransferase
VTQEYRDTAFAVFQKAAIDNDVAIVAGFNDIEPGQSRNHAVVFSEEGKIVADYDKVFLIPGAEWNYKPGNSISEFVLSGVRSGVAICKDMDFPGWIRKSGESDLRMLFVPAWDFVVDGSLHSRMAVMRGIENGFCVVRSATQGRLTLSDAYGRVLLEAQSSGVPIQSLMGDIPPGPGTTLYSKAGDWFGWLNLLGLLTTMCMWSWTRSKPTRA